MCVYGPPHAKMCLQAYTGSKSSDQPVQSDQGLHCPLTELLDTTEYVNVDLHILRMFEGAFLA